MGLLPATVALSTNKLSHSITPTLSRTPSMLLTPDSETLMGVVRWVCVFILFYVCASPKAVVTLKFRGYESSVKEAQ